MPVAEERPRVPALFGRRRQRGRASASSSSRRISSSMNRAPVPGCRGYRAEPA